MCRGTLHTAERVPVPVDALARARHLGAHRETYRPRTLHRVTAVLCGLGGTLCLLAALALVRVGLWPVGLACAALGVCLLYRLARTPGFAGRQAGKRVDVYANGFIQSDASGPRVALRWDSIDSVCQRITRNYPNGISTGTTYIYTITSHDGTTVRLTQFYVGIAALGETIVREVTRVQLPRAMAAIQRGETVTFGELALNARGITCTGRSQVPWAQVDRVQVNRGYVSLRQAGRWQSWSRGQASQIPNLFVFLTLADLLQQNRGDTRQIAIL